ARLLGHVEGALECGACNICPAQAGERRAMCGQRLGEQPVLFAPCQRAHRPRHRAFGLWRASFAEQDARARIVYLRDEAGVAESGEETFSRVEVRVRFGEAPGAT